MAAILNAIYPLARRQEVIREKLLHPLGTQKFYQYTRPLDLSVIELSIDLPVYRLANGRTAIDQKKYLSENQLDPSFFLTGQEDIEAQTIQHGILVAYAKREKGETVAIYDVLREQGQTEELLLTTDGVVLNGNRRLAAMRELLAEDSTQFRSFQNIRALVLNPGFSRRDLLTIEARLQAARPTRLDYDWLSELLLLRSLKQEGTTDAELADIYRFRNEQEVKEHLAMLDEADIYLDQRLNAPGKYELITDSEQQFRELIKATMKAEPLRKEAARAIHHVLTENPPTAGRKYDARVAYGRDLDRVVEKLATRMSPNLDRAINAPPSETDESLFLDDLIPTPVDDNGTHYAPVIAALQDRSDSAAKALEIIDVLAEIKDEREDQDKGTIALRNAREALKRLQGIQIRTADPATLDELKRTLSTAVEVVQNLLSSCE